MSRIFTGALVTAAALSGTIYWETRDNAAPDLVAAPRAPVTSVAHAAPGPDANEVMQGWTSTALARPLFREDRRPPAVSADAGPKGDGPTRLTGVITGPEGNRAIFMAGTNAKPIVAKEGAHVSDFVVRSIKPGQVVVEADGMVRTIKLTFSDVAKPPRP